MTGSVVSILRERARSNDNCYIIMGFRRAKSGAGSSIDSRIQMDTFRNKLVIGQIVRIRKLNGLDRNILSRGMEAISEERKRGGKCLHLEQRLHFSFLYPRHSLGRSLREMAPHFGPI